MCIIRRSRRMILTCSCWATIGSGSRGIRIAGALVGISWGVRFLITGAALSLLLDISDHSANSLT